MQVLPSSRALRSPLSSVGGPMPFAALECLFAIINLGSVVRLVGCALLGDPKMKRRPWQVVICCISYLASLAMVDMFDNNNQHRNANIIPLLVNGILVALYEGENMWHFFATDSTFLKRLFGGFIIFIFILIFGLSTWLTIRSDDLSQVLITLLSSTLGIYVLLGFGNLYLFQSQMQENRITRRIHAVSWVGCFLVFLSTLIFLILGYKGIAGGLTFYTWVIFTLSSMFAARNPTVKLWRVMFSNSQIQDGQFPLGSRPGSGPQSTESIQEQLDPESYGELAPTPLV